MSVMVRWMERGGGGAGLRCWSLPCIAWRCSACGSPPPGGTWSPGHGAGPPSSPRTAGLAGSSGPGLGWTGSCSGPAEGQGHREGLGGLELFWF